MTIRMTGARQTELVASAVRKVHRHGRRGAETVTVEEIEALAFFAVEASIHVLSNRPNGGTDDQSPDA